MINNTPFYMLLCIHIDYNLAVYEMGITHYLYNTSLASVMCCLIMLSFKIDRSQDYLDNFTLHI